MSNIAQLGFESLNPNFKIDKPVVRCKDCKYFTNNIADENLRKNFCDRIQINCFHSVKENDYCSYGTKVDEDKCET